MPPVITSVQTKEEFLELLSQNKQVVFLRLTATWCKPCQKIKPALEHWFSQLLSNENITCMSLDIDDNFEIYSALKNKRLIQGIPVVLCYRLGNISIVPDESVSGTNIDEINGFFTRCLM